VIADFLDRETSRIDQLIEKKERMVALLGEKQQLLIAAAIEHDGPQTKLGHHVSILSGYAFASENFSSDTDDIRLLRGVNVSTGTIRWDDTVYWPKNMLSGLDRFELAGGDVVLGMDRPWISSGIRVAELTEQDAPSLLLQRVCRIKPLATLDKNYMKLLLASRRFLAHFEPILTGVSVPHISADQVAAFRFPLVDLSRQHAAAKSCGSALAKASIIEGKIARSVERLRELRAAIITAAVTGHIDVATWGKRSETNRRLNRIEEKRTAKGALA
jgi:type I restriction enzyme, S subunit